jgi:signal transduction histidine kinase
MESTDLLVLENISRDYGTLEAVRGVNLRMGRGEIHALVGEHGAGKSTLAMIISGMLSPKTGGIEFRDRKYSQVNLKLSNRLGIKMVYQQVYLNDYFTVAENLFYTDPRVTHFGWYSNAKMKRAAEALLTAHELDIDPTARLKGLSLSDRTVVDILKQVSKNPVLLILDESLEKLSAQALNKIVPMLLKRKAEGMSILFITHRIDDIYNFAERVSIMRAGQIVFTGTTSDIDKINLVRLAYTQISSQITFGAAETEFSRFLKYNEAILEHLPISLLVTDTENRIKLANDYFKSAFTLADRDYLNKPIMNLLSGLSDEAVDELKRALSHKGDHEIYNVALSLNNRITLNNFKTLPVYDNGFHIGNILVIEDITEYDKLQKQVILTEKLASVGLLAAGVAHEINNPLEIIYNYLSYLRYRSVAQDTRETVEKLREEISYISNIVSNLLNLADTNRIAKEEINLNEVVVKMLDLLQHSAKSRNITMSFHPASDVRAIANANEVKQVLLNLIKNGFEAIPDGGTITVSTEEVMHDGVASAQVTVWDSGPGINAKNPNDVFLPFYSTKKGKTANLGLGLSVSYAILERYQGKLTAENVPDGGCRFIMTIPQHPQSPDTDQDDE